MNKITVPLGPEEMKKIGLIQSRMRLPSKELAVRKAIELFSINPGTR